MKKFETFVALPLILAILVTGCANGEVEQAEGIFIEGQSGADAETLNWILAADATSSSYVGHTMDRLVTYDNELNIVLHCLARDIETSADGLVYTITIRDI